MNYQNLSNLEWIKIAQIYFNYAPDAAIPMRIVNILREALSDKSEDIRMKATRELEALAGR